MNDNTTQNHHIEDVLDMASHDPELQPYLARDADAMAEGIIECHEGFAVDRQGSCWGPNARSAYELLWGSINGPGSWESNPWVTATTFDVVQTNIG